MRIGFIGLGNVGAKLAGTLLHNGLDLTVRDLNRDAARPLLQRGAEWADSPAAMARAARDRRRNEVLRIREASSSPVALE